jgi:GNAT superfamily N-acetyltransferase
MALFHHLATSYLPGGYTFRGATLKDVASVVYLLNQRQLTDIAFCAEGLRQAWQARPFNPAMDVRLVFDPREMLVGYLQFWLDENHPLLWGCVHPAYEGRGVGSALLRWGEARVGLALDQIPASLWVAPHFSTLPVPRAQELCEHLGWRQVRPQTAEIKKVTGALHLPETVDLQYAVYEKAIDQLN